MSIESNATPLVDIIVLWRAVGPKGWFKKDAVLDAEIRARFLKLYEDAAAGGLAD